MELRPRARVCIRRPPPQERHVERKRGKMRIAKGGACASLVAGTERRVRERVCDAQTLSRLNYTLQRRKEVPCKSEHVVRLQAVRATPASVALSPGEAAYCAGVGSALCVV